MRGRRNALGESCEELRNFCAVGAEADQFDMQSNRARPQGPRTSNQATESASDHNIFRIRLPARQRSARLAVAPTQT